MRAGSGWVRSHEVGSCGRGRGGSSGERLGRAAWLGRGDAIEGEEDGCDREEGGQGDPGDPASDHVRELHGGEGAGGLGSAALAEAAADDVAFAAVDIDGADVDAAAV